MSNQREADNERVTVTGTIINETEKAFLMVIDDKEHWIPKSQITDADQLEVDADDEVDIDIPMWLARNHGID